jgi:hypothetical protein
MIWVERFVPLARIKKSDIFQISTRQAAQQNNALNWLIGQPKKVIHIFEMGSS